MTSICCVFRSGRTRAGLECVDRKQTTGRYLPVPVWCRRTVGVMAREKYPRKLRKALGYIHPLAKQPDAVHMYQRCISISDLLDGR